MFKQDGFNKKALIVFLIVFVLAIMFFLIFFRHSQLKENTPNQIPMDKRDREQQEVVLKSEIVKQKVIESNGVDFPHITLDENGEELIIAIYDYTTTADNLIEPPGFLVFKYNIKGNLQKIANIQGAYPGTACILYFSEKNGVMDLNNDGIKEFIINTNCLRGGDKEFWIYIWKNNTFKFISATDPKESRKVKDNVFVATQDNNFQFIDIENDGKIEVSLLYRDYVRLGPGVNDIRIDVYKRTYRWDGTEKPYYLWKEEKIGEEKPESVEP